MKKAYTKPVMEIEEYSLSEYIADNCTETRNWGPLELCEGFSEDDWNVPLMVTYSSSSSNGTSFYEQDHETHPCDCYLTSGNEGYFTS